MPEFRSVIQRKDPIWVCGRYMDYSKMSKQKKMTSLYLVAALLFLVAFFRQDHKEWPRYSKSLWIAQLWLVASTTRLIIILFPTFDEGGTGLSNIERNMEANPISRVIFIVLIAAAIVLIIKRQNSLASLVRGNWAIYLLYGYALASIMWSAYPDVAIRRYIKLCGCLLIAFLLKCEEEHHEALEHLLRRHFAVCLTLSLYFVKTDRSIGYIISAHGDYFMAGIAGHKNDLGILCVYSLIFLTMRAIKIWPSLNYYDLVLALIDFYFLFRAQSTTALVLALLGVALLVALGILGDLRHVTVIIVVLVIITLPILMITMNSPGSTAAGAFFSATGKDATLTGRIPLWKDLIHLGKNDIFLGSGYESFWIRYYREVWVKWTFLPISAHNGFIEMLLNLGFLGLSFILIALSKSLKTVASKASLSQPLGHMNLVILILFIISNITESWFMTMSLGWNLFLLILLVSEKNRSVLVT